MRKRLVETLRDIGIAVLDDYERLIRADERAKLREGAFEKAKTWFRECLAWGEVDDDEVRDLLAAIFDKEG
jgi:hypothetical protein